MEKLKNGRELMISGQNTPEKRLATPVFFRFPAYYPWIWLLWIIIVQQRVHSGLKKFPYLTAYKSIINKITFVKIHPHSQRTKYTTLDESFHPPFLRHLIGNNEGSLIMPTTGHAFIVNNKNWKNNNKM